MVVEVVVMVDKEDASIVVVIVMEDTINPTINTRVIFLYFFLLHQQSIIVLGTQLESIMNGETLPILPSLVVIQILLLIRILGVLTLELLNT